MNRIKALIIAVFIGFLGTILITGKSDVDNVQQELAEKLLRFHVIANSDSTEDQTLKLTVKDRVVNYMSPYFQNEMSLEDAKQVVNDHMDEIVALAQETIYEEGYNYNVSASLETSYFPIKSYGDVTLPAGNYEAFRIEIGRAEGKNWWCILYPPLCFVDVSYGIVPDSSKLLLKNLLDEDEYLAVTGEADVTYSFRIIEYLKDLLS